MVQRILRNSLVLVVSMLVLHLGLGGLGSVFADEPVQEGRPVPQRRLPQQARTPATPATPVKHDTKFHGVPDSKLEIRAVTYDGSTNGKLTVEIRNAGKAAEKFSAAGLYFVPEGNPDTAPQRLGAVGPMQMAGGAREEKELEIAAGATVAVTLDVFCIDSHRSSPSPQNVFNVGASRLPKELTRTIEYNADAEVAAKRTEGAPAPRPAAKAAIQGKVWESRDKRWVPLDGEGKQEAGKRR